MEKKELEFKINNNVLTVSDFDWLIDRIDAIYVRRSEMNSRKGFAIFIQQGSEIVELYFRTNDELLIAKEYKKLINVLKEIRPTFDNSVDFYVLINYANLKYVGLKTNLIDTSIRLEFNNYHLNISGGKKKYNEILQILESKNYNMEV